MKRQYFTTAMFASMLMLPSIAKPAIACLTISPDAIPIHTRSEEAIIVWDARTHTEHFIRTANFHTNAKDFGFLVPTPTVPTLKPIDLTTISTLDAYTAHKYRVITHHSTRFNSWLFPYYPPMPMSLKRSAPEDARVDVLATHNVAGLNAVTLEASDTHALVQWLSKHNYPSNPDLNAWLMPYVAKHWKITAFKIAKPSTEDDGVSSTLVDMKFTTDRPFYPYREPAQNQNAYNVYPTRLLRVYVFSSTRMDAQIAPNPKHIGWPGQTHWANQLDAPLTLNLSHQLGVTLPANTWMTRFDDKSSPRPGIEDLFFSPSKQNTTVIPATIIENIDDPKIIMIEPIILVFALIGTGIWIAIRSRRRTNRLGLKPEKVS